MASTDSHMYRRVPVLLTTDEAEVFSVTPRTIRNWARRGWLTPLRMGGATRYRATEIERLTADPESSAEGVNTD